MLILQSNLNIVYYAHVFEQTNVLKGGQFFLFISIGLSRVFAIKIKEGLLVGL